MTVYDISRHVGEWVTDELGQASALSGEEFGYRVTMGVMPTPQGDAILWIVLVTLRSPYLGADHLGTTTKVQANVPNETVVRNGIKAAVEGLRKAYKAREAEGFPQGNGHNQAGLPPGLARRKM